MNAQMQQGMFTHGKCTKCGYLALLDKFSMVEKPLDNILQEKCNKIFGEITLSTYTGTCPMCGCEFVEFLYANEVN